MARLKPRVKIPYKRYEKSFDRSAESSGEQEEGFIVLKDITSNPSIAATNLKHERPEEETGDPNPAENASDKPEPTSKTEITLNKKIKIRRKLR